MRSSAKYALVLAAMVAAVKLLPMAHEVGGFNPEAVAIKSEAGTITVAQDECTRAKARSDEAERNVEALKKQIASLKVQMENLGQQAMAAETRAAAALKQAKIA
jgi:phage shock protein A